MKIIILEGTSTGGKTTLAKLISKKLGQLGKTVLVISEDQTLIPILQNKDPRKAVSHLLDVVKSSLSKDVDYLIFDRLHLTPIAITNSDIKTFSEIEELLLSHETMLVSINIAEDKLLDRVYKALEHRGPSWAAHVEGHGTKEDVKKHYIVAQKKVISHFNQSSLRKISIDATNNNYEQISTQIIKQLGE